jgi:probable F420-dependent oxidoreductase
VSGSGSGRSLGVVLPFWLDRPDLEAVRIAERAAAHSFERVWCGEMATFDAFALASAIGQAASPSRLTIGPLAVGVRSPVALALGLSSVATLAGCPVDLALGASSPEIVSAWHDRPWSHAPERTRETVAALRDLLAGDRAAHQGVHVRTRGFRLRAPQPGTRIGVAAFGARMTRVAAEVADDVVLNLVAPEQVAKVRAMVDAARPAGSPRARLAVWVACALNPGPAAHRQLAGQLAVYLRPPGYGEMFTELGFGDLVTLARSNVGRAELSRAIRPELAASVGAIGSPAEIADRLAQYFAAGADHIGIVPVTAQDADGAEVLAAVAAARDQLLAESAESAESAETAGTNGAGDATGPAQVRG